MKETIIDVVEATYRYPGAEEDVLEPVSLQVSEGSAIGLVGESGSGKSTFARMLVGLLSPTSGKVLVGGDPWTKVRRKDRRRRDVQMVFQDPFGALNPGLPAIETVAEVFRVCERLSPADAYTRAVVLLSEMELAEHDMYRTPSRLSGGQCQRVGLARALAARPRVLIADEPTSALDSSVQAQILELLRELRARHDFALVFISHDLAVIRNITNDVLVMREGKIVERGRTHEVFDNPRQAYTRALLDSIPGRAHRRKERIHDEPA